MCFKYFGKQTNSSLENLLLQFSKYLRMSKYDLSRLKKEQHIQIYKLLPVGNIVYLFVYVQFNFKFLGCTFVKNYFLYFNLSRFL